MPGDASDNKEMQSSTAEDMVVGGQAAIQTSGHSGSVLDLVPTNQAGPAVDEELTRALKLMRLEDDALTLALEHERSQMESSMERIHRMNNFRIDEAHIREANIAESRFLIETQNAERKALAVQEIEEAEILKEEEADRRMVDMLMRELRYLKMSVRSKAQSAEKVALVKRKLAERRIANQLRLNGIEVRQERERKALQESHTRIMKVRNGSVFTSKVQSAMRAAARAVAAAPDNLLTAYAGRLELQNMSLFRTLILQETEDPDLRDYLRTGRMDNSAEKNEAQAQAMLEADKMHQAKILQLKLRMQKEVEQLREEHLMRLKHMMKICEMELDQTEETQTLIAEQKIQELELEVENKKELEGEEDQIAQQRASLKAFQTQRNLQTKASKTLALQRQEARQLARQQKIAAKQREKQYFASEEALREALRNMAEETEGDEEETSDISKQDRISSARQSIADGSEISFGDAQSDYSDITTDTHGESLMDAEEANQNAAAADAADDQDSLGKESARLSQLRQRQNEAMESLRIQQREIREAMKREHAQQMSNVHNEQEAEFKNLKIQHHKETEALLSSQNTANALEEDNKGANELLYGMLPRYVADAMKMGAEVPPKDFECVTILFSDIVQFTNLTAKSSPDQIVNLLNRLYTCFDAVLDDYADLYKTETIGDAYQIVAGLNADVDGGDPKAVVRRNAIDSIDAAVRFIEFIKSMDMSDQVQNELYIRIGIHSGPCVGGVAGVTMPKFAIFGDSATIAGQMEQKSSPNSIHISESTYELVKDAPYLFEPTAAPVTLEGGMKMKTYWVTGRKKVEKPKGAARKKGKVTIK
ncbi:Heat-stable enterotoxin receptor [Geranomyces variabilis]|uniref:Heat-stable enterotoxin receptor n=1 Tax=Geranomyces variabilis TaxID=109894 RepID=A0AAD5TJS1_9FUNG|nr:Heat-stable enterotoxin receptor [Geranomyces variabilis]